MRGQRRVLVATGNIGKLAELAEMLGQVETQIEWLSLRDFPDVVEIAEDGATFAENARKKATGYAQATGLWTIADDSGLVIDALDGEPGVRSARFSGVQQNQNDRALLDHKNIAKVLRLMQGIPQEKRTARFVCCLCLAKPQSILLETEGKVEGVITRQPEGLGGFGYDPLFFIPTLGRTVAQLNSEEKNAVSHRGNAVRKLKPALAGLLNKRM